MIKIIKLANSGLAPTYRAGCNERVPATWGVEVNGRLAARIFTVGGDSVVVDAESGRCLYQTVYVPRKRGQSRVAIAKDWASKHFASEAAA
jgi:hypothetical protein